MAARNKNSVRPGKPISKDETPDQKFVRLANFRTSKALKAIEQIGKLGAKSYESTQEQRDRIITALNEGIETMADQLNAKETPKQQFRL